MAARSWGQVSERLVGPKGRGKNHIRGTTVTNKPDHRGGHEVSRKTIARGMPGDFRCDRGDYARVLYSFAREAAGALGIRHSLRPLFSWANGSCTTRAHRAARMRSRIWS